MIELLNVAGGYQQTVFCGLSFSVKRGSVCVLLGSNGSGKSTLLKTIGGLLPPKTGKILVDGKDAALLSGRQRARMMACMMQRNTSPAISVEALVLHGRYPHLSFPRRLAPDDYAVANKAMATLDLLPLKNKLLPTLSGGELQKAYLAMALAQDTPALLLDEPNAYLDIHHQQELLQMMLQLKKMGKTIIAALHDLPGALEIADDIAVLDGGKLSFYGPPRQLMEEDALNRCLKADVKVLEKDGRLYYSVR